jgi:hypothetical protein
MAQMGKIMHFTNNFGASFEVQYWRAISAGVAHNE